MTYERIDPGIKGPSGIKSLMDLMKAKKNFLNDIQFKLLRKVRVVPETDLKLDIAMTLKPYQKLLIGDLVTGVGSQDESQNHIFGKHGRQTSLDVYLQSIKERVMPRPHVKIDFKTMRYHVKTATTWKEIFSVLRLRHEIFFREFIGITGKKKLIPLDVDRHDFSFDHLIVKDLSKNKVVACYRLQSSQHKKAGRKFYTEEEFKLDNFLAIPGHKVELGRASVHKDYRKGTVVTLLWQGLFQYVKSVDANYLFGCSSIGRPHFHRMPKILNEISDERSLHADFRIEARKQYALKSLSDLNVGSESAKAEDEKGLNSLMSMYMMAGAKFSRELAYDQELDCIDIFTCLDLTKLPEIFEQKLKRKS